MSGNATLGTAVAEISLDYSKLEAGINASKTKMDALKFAMADLAVVGVGAAVGIGVATVKMAGDFQAGMTSLVTGAGESQKNLGLVSDGILNLATQTGTSTKDLTDGMYMIESAGYHGAAGLLVLKAAAEGAQVGSASLADVANGVTTAMTDYSSSGLTASQATNTLIATVAAGKTHMGDLANSLANILPTSSSAGVGLTDVMGAMATMTGEGVPAAQAATYLRQTILGLVAPSAGTVKALDAVGLKSADVASEMKKSLPDALQMITDAVGKKFPEGSAGYINAIKNISGGSKTMQGMLDLTGDHLKTFEGNVKNISGTVKSGGDSIQGWTLVQQDFNTKVAQAKEVVETLGIKIGTALLPVATSLFNLVLPLVSGFDDWITKSGALNQITGDLSDGISNISGFIATLTGNANSCGTTFGSAAPLLMDFQTVIGNIKDILPDVGQFLTEVGTDVGTNLLPPLENLGVTIANVVTNFTNWADKSGAAKTALNDVEGVIKTTTQVLGPLINAVATTVGWLGGGGAGTDTLVVALSAVATAFVMLKIANTVSQFSQLWGNLSQGEGLVANLAGSVKDKLGGAFDSFLSKQAPAFKKSLDDMKAKGDSAGTSVEEMGTKTQVAGAKVATAGTEAETASGEIKQLSLWEDEAGTKAETMGTDASVAGAEVKTLGADAATSATEVEAMGAKSEATAGEVALTGTDAAAAGVAETGFGVAAMGAVGGVVALLGPLAALLLLQQQLAIIGNILHGAPSIETHGTVTGPDGTKYQGGGINNYKGGKGWATGGTNIAEGDYWVGELGPERIHVPQGSTILNHEQSMALPYSPGGGSSVPYASGGNCDPILLRAINNLADAFAHHQHDIYMDSNKVGHAIVQKMRVRTGTRS